MVGRVASLDPVAGPSTARYARQRTSYATAVCLSLSACLPPNRGDRARSTTIDETRDSSVATRSPGGDSADDRRQLRRNKFFLILPALLRARSAFPKNYPEPDCTRRTSRCSLVLIRKIKFILIFTFSLNASRPSPVARFQRAAKRKSIIPIDACNSRIYNSRYDGGDLAANGTTLSHHSPNRG